jgi:hypothetical protein
MWIQKELIAALKVEVECLRQQRDEWYNKCLQKSKSDERLEELRRDGSRKKDIAIQIARNRFTDSAKTEDMLAEAEKIYQWLISAPRPTQNNNYSEIVSKLSQ